VSVFDDMIRRSVPGYAAVIAMTSVFAEQYAKAGTNLYDLGCSLGASTLALRKGVDKAGCKIVAVDNSAAMIGRCREIVGSEVSDVPVEICQADIEDIEICNASVVVMNFTLQFISPEVRQEMIQRIYDGLVPGGVLLLSEKVAFDDADEQDFQIDMHHHFKRLNGYSALEVSQKRKSLENVLLPDTVETHFARLKSAGFEKSYRWFECFNFTSVAAFKGLGDD
jgi:tRNA (cmo5U34)-methyltransferase